MQTGLVLSSQAAERHVIRIYDLGEAQGVKFITMEYAEGGNLHRIMFAPTGYSLTFFSCRRPMGIYE